MRGEFVVVAAGLLALGMPRARAAERPYAFVQGVDTLPQGSLELESWYGEEKPRGGPADWEWWLGPVVGLTDRVEAGLLAVFDQPGTAPQLALAHLRWQLSWALADKGAWPVDVRLRAELSQPVGPEHVAAYLWAIAGRDFGPVNATVDLSGWLEWEDGVSRYLDLLAGVSWQALRGVRLGGELQASKEIGAGSKLFAGPSLALARGRVWLSSSFGFGIGADRPEQHARVVLGLSL